jgi:hypothetical protein
MSKNKVHCFINYEEPCDVWCASYIALTSEKEKIHLTNCTILNAFAHVESLALLIIQNWGDLLGLMQIR